MFNVGRKWYRSCEWISGDVDKGSFPGLCWELPEWGERQTSNHCEDNTTGRCYSVEEDLVLPWEEQKFLFAVFKYFIPFLFLQTLLAEIEKPFSRGWHSCPGGNRLVKCICHLYREVVGVMALLQRIMGCLRCIRWSSFTRNKNV